MTLARWIVRPLYWALFWPRVYGRDNLLEFRRGAVVLASNHIHPLDAATLGVLGARNLHFLSKADLGQGAIGLLFRHFDLIFVDRDVTNNAVSAAEKYLRRGMAVAIFPEGTCSTERKQPDELLPFKYGAVKMALATGAPIVPMGIAGNYRPFSRLQVRFGRPLYFAKNLSLDEANERLRDAVAQLLEQSSLKVRKIPGRPAKNPSKDPPILDQKFKSKEKRNG